MFESLLGQSPNFVSLLRKASMVAATDANVLLIGETGTGKEELARALHRNGSRTAQPFVTHNCAALPSSLTTAALFGHDKKTFPGASNKQVGCLAAAHGGTVFLDEVDALPSPLQTKLLQFLETGELLASNHAVPLKVDVRLIATTHTRWQNSAGVGLQREEWLIFRRRVVSLEIPPLRERGGDVQLLVSHFIERFSKTHGLPRISFSKAAMRRLMDYPWPGNVRELRNVCERLCILLAGCVIEENNLPAEIICRMPARKPSVALPVSGVNLSQVERDLIRQALERTNGNRTRSAKLLSISRDALSYRMQKYGIGPSSVSVEPTGIPSPGLTVEVQT